MATAKKKSASAPIIVIAEDDKFLGNIYAENFRKKNLTVALFVNGREAVDAIEAGKIVPDLVILDLHMPEMDGFAVLNHFKREQHKFPVIILSNLRTDLDQDKAMELGAADFIVKSDISFKDLWVKVEKHLQK
jgi:DNA-binding response OmpR family regulator